MAQPTDLDRYTELIATPDDQLIQDKLCTPSELERLHRIRGIYAFFVGHPTTTEKEIFQRLTTGGMPGLAPVKKSQAFADLNIVRYLIGNLELASKQFTRWKINQELEDDIRKARAQGDYKAVAALQKVRVANFRTDKEDELEMKYENIVPLLMEPSDDPTVLGFNPQKNLRGRIKDLNKQLAPAGEYMDYQEVEEDERDD